MNESKRRTLTIKEAAEILGVSEWTAGEIIQYFRRRTGTLAGVPVIRIGRRILIPRAALLRVVDGEPDPEIEA